MENKKYSVYLITNNVNNKKYVGITSKDVYVRYQQHLEAAKKIIVKNYCIKN